MARLNGNDVTAINKIISKGDHIVAVGTTESGKSTAIGFMAMNDSVRSLMSIREASGKGSTIETHIVVTDYKKIPEDKMIIRAKVLNSHIATCGDDNELLAKVLYNAVRKCNNECSEEVYEEQIRKTIEFQLKEPSNDSLAYKLKNASEEELNSIVLHIKAFDYDKMMMLLTEAKAKFEKKNYSSNSRSKVEPRIFKELLSEKQEFSETLDKFWTCITKILNNQVKTLLDNLEASGAIINDERDSFTISLGDEDFDSDIANILLRSENMSIEYLFSDMFIIFRGNEEFYTDRYGKYLTAFEENGEEIHCLSIIDTMGLFHSTGATAEEESERIIDIIAKNHSNKLLLVVNSDVTDTVKDGYEATKSMLSKLNREIEIYILYTHWDKYLINEANKSQAGNRRGRTNTSIQWKDLFVDAESKQKELTDSFSNCISTSGKSKPTIVGTYKAALTLGEGTRAENILSKNHVDYNIAIKKILNDILLSINKKGPKFRVKDGMLDGCNVTPESRVFDVKKLYRNMVVDCKGHKYWASSVRAVNTKWCSYGTKHDSDIKENDNGFMNIHSDFVMDMRNFAMSILNNTNSITINLSNYVVEADKVKEVESLVLQYLKTGQNFGKEFAKIVGRESFEKGFKRNPRFCYQYERLTDMIQYTQDNFFKGELIKIDNPEAALVVEFLQKALDECVTNFINAKCIEVY